MTTTETVGVIVGVALVALGVAAVVRAHRLVPGEPDEEEREQKGPLPTTRRRLLRGGIGTAAVAVGLVSS